MVEQRVTTIYEILGIDGARKKLTTMSTTWEKHGTSVSATTKKLNADILKLAKAWNIGDEELGKLLTALKIDTKDAFTEQAKTVEGARRTFQMYWLSIMFGAMQAQRFLGRVFDDMKKSYFEITENTTALGQATLRLQGAFTYLQVSIMTALEPILIPFLEWLIDTVNWFAELPPVVQQVAGLFVIGGLFTASIVVAGAQLMLFINGILDAGTAFGIFTKNLKTGAIEMGTTSSKIGTSFSNLVPIIILAGLLIYSTWKNIGEYLAWETKKSLDIQKKDWTAYKIHAIASNIELQHAIPKILETILFTIGDLIHQAATLVGQVLLKIMNFIYRIGAMMPGPMGEWFAGMAAGAAELETEFTKTMTDLRVAATKGYTDIQEGLTRRSIIEMAKMGVAWEEIIEVYGNSENTISALTAAADEMGISHDKIYEALSKVNTITNESITATDLLKKSQQEATEAWNSEAEAIALVTEKVEGLNNAWKIAGRSGIYSFNVGGKGVDIERSLQILADPNTLKGMQMGGFVPRTGPYLLHRGETVVPRTEDLNMGNISVNITTGPITSPADEESLARRVSERIMSDIRNYTKYVTHF